MRWLEQTSSFNLSIRTESSWASSPLKQAPYFRQAHDGSCSNQTTHVQGTHDYAYVLGSSEGHRCSCIGFFFLSILLLLGELMESFPTSPTEESHLACASKTRWAVIAAHEVTLRDSTAPSDPATHSVEAKAFTILLRLCSTARYLFPSFVTKKLSLIQSTTSPMSVLA